MHIKPIKSHRDYLRALKQVERLMGASAGSSEGDSLDVLTTLIEAWESKHESIAAPDPVAAIEFAMEQRGLTREDLEASIGSRGRVAEILNRKRPLTLMMIRRLNANLGIPAESLIRPPSAA